jgi:hypothetical protein
MGLEAVFALALFTALVLAAMRASGGGVQAMSGLFRAPDLGWPTGVQEDDDFHWTWAATDAERPADPRTPGAEPEWQELDPSSLRVPTQPIVRRALVVGHHP